MDLSILHEVETFARRADALTLLADQARNLLAQAQQRAQQNEAEAQRLKKIADDLAQRAQQIVIKERQLREGRLPEDETGLDEALSGHGTELVGH